MNPTKHPRETLILITIFLLSAIEFLQSGMIVFGSAPIIGEIGASPEEFTMVTLVYAVVAIGAISQQRWLIDRMGWRGFIQALVVVYIIGTAICATSTSFPQFLLGRVVMAISGGPFLTSARVIVQMLPPNKRRFRGIMAYAGALTVGNGLAPLCASIAVSHDRWPAIFVMLAVLAALAGAVGTLALPAEVTPVEGRSQSQPLLVLILMAGACLSLYALLRASYDFYSDGLQLLLAVIMGLLALYYFVRHQYHHEQPLLVVRRLVNARYIAGMGVFGLGYMVLGANNYMLPVLMQSALGFPWEVVGRVQSAGLIVATPIFAIQVAIMMKNLSAKKFYVTGFTFLTLSGLWMVHLNEQAGLWTDVWPGIALFGAFITPVMVTTALHSFIDLQADERAFGNGQQIKNMLSQFGVAIGVAGAALGLQWRNSEHLAVLVQRFSPDDATFSGLAGRLGGQFVASHGAQAAQVAVGTLAQQVNQQVVLLSSLDYFGVLAAIGVLGALMMVTQRVLK